MKLFVRPLVGALVLASGVALGSDSEIRLEYFTDSPSLFQERKPVTFWHRFESTFVERSDEVFTDRLHSFRLVSWNMDQTLGQTPSIADSAATAARRSLERSVSYGLREAALGFPGLEWLVDDPTIIFEFLRDTVDEVYEESVAPLDPSFGLAERSWWKRLRSGGHLRYGVRPFRTSPYLFMSFRANRDDNIYLMGHVRYYFRHWAEQRLELALSVPLVHGFILNAGTAFHLTERDLPTTAVVKLFKNFGQSGVMHLGFEVKQHPTVLAGLAFTW